MRRKKDRRSEGECRGQGAGKIGWQLAVGKRETEKRENGEEDGESVGQQPVIGHLSLGEENKKNNR